MEGHDSDAAASIVEEIRAARVARDEARKVWTERKADAKEAKERFTASQAALEKLLTDLDQPRLF